MITSSRQQILSLRYCTRFLLLSQNGNLKQFWSNPILLLFASSRYQVGQNFILYIKIKDSADHLKAWGV